MLRVRNPGRFRVAGFPELGGCMIRNVGALDRVLRVLLGVALLTFALAGEHVAAWGWIGILPLATGLSGYCPLYHVLHLSTVRKSVS